MPRFHVGKTGDTGFYFIFLLFAFLSFDRRNTLVIQGEKKISGNVIKIIANDGVYFLTDAHLKPEAKHIFYLPRAVAV